MAVTGGKTLTIFLAADLKKFNSGMREAQTGLSGFGGSLKNVLGPALIGAGIAVAGLATAMAVDGVKAAVEDEAAMAKLATTMDNLGLAHDTQKVEDYVYQLERSLGIADTELRPAYDRLVRALGDTEKAQDALSLSLDISAGSGKSLQAVTEALGKAYEGNIVGLSRLGAGIDATILRSGDMDLITRTLATTFEGQAKTSAGTYEGQIKRLSTAADNMKEAFGAGLLKGLGDTETATNDVVSAFEDLEPLLKNTGEAISTFASTGLTAYTNAMKRSGNETEVTADQVAGLGASARASGGLIGEIFASLSGPQSPLGTFLRVLGAVSDAADNTGNRLVGTADNMERLARSTNTATQSLDRFLQANGVKLKLMKEENLDYQDLAARQRDVNTATETGTTTTTEYGRATGGSSAEVEKLTKKEKELLKTFEDKNAALTKNREALGYWTDELSKANEAISDFTGNMQSNLLAGVDLGKAYEAGFNDEGERVGLGVVAGFQAMIDEANWFGNVLNALKAAHVDQGLIDYMSELGPGIGGKLGQEMLGDKGLLAKLNEQWVNVQSTTKTLAESLVPEFMIAGQESALTMVDSISEQMSKEVKRLAKIGKKIAQPLGQSFRAELMKDVAAALREVEAAGAAGRAETVANAQAKQVALTNQAVAQALQDLVRSADARNGRPVAPVLS